MCKPKIMPLKSASLVKQEDQVKQAKTNAEAQMATLSEAEAANAMDLQ